MRDWPLVGRIEELALLADNLVDPVSGGVVITGQAGTGKTRLVREAVRGLGVGGREVRQAAGSRSAGEIPLGAFATLLPSIPDDAGRTFDGLQWARQALGATAPERRGVLVVDDAHLLDPASATLLHQVASDRSQSLLVTLRSSEPMPDALVALWKDGLADRLELQPLSRDETTELLEKALGGEIADPTVETWWTASRGNPMFLRELVLGALEAGTLVTRHGVWMLNGPMHVPTSIHELVQDRLRVDDRQRRVLDMLAVADQVDLELVTALHADVDLAGLERDGLVTVDQVAGEHVVSLDHPLLGEVVRAQLPTTTTIAIARRLAEAVEQRERPRPGDILRSATWRLIVGGEVKPGVMATAAKQAYHAGDFDLAERLAREAIARNDPTDVHVMLGSLLQERGEHEESEQLLSEVTLEELPPQLVITAAMTRCENLFYGLGRADDAMAVLDEAEAFLSDPSDLLAERADKLVKVGRPADALATVEPVRGRSQTVFSQFMQAKVQALLGDTRTALETFADAAARVARSNFPCAGRHDELRAQIIRCLILLHDGQLAEAEALTRSGRAQPAGNPPFLHSPWTDYLGRVSLQQGRVATAASMFHHFASRQRQIGHTGCLRAALARLASAAAQAGDAAGANGAAQQLENAPEHPMQDCQSHEHAAHGWAVAASGDLPTARRHLRIAADTARQQGFVTIEARHLHDMLRLDETEPDVLERLVTLADVSSSAAVTARADHAVARSDGRAAMLDAVGARFAQLGMRLHAAEAYVEAAAAYRAAGSRRANASLRRADQLLEDCEGAQTPALHRPDPVDPLTPREREVVLLAASGRTSGDIADQLVVSVRTIDNHLHRAYVKLGVHTRNEAAEVLGLSGASGRSSRRAALDR